MEKQKLSQEEKKESNNYSNKTVWDCGSTLYDSFELNSFKHQLDSAINRRTLSMSHLPERRVTVLQKSSSSSYSSSVTSRKPYKISRSFRKFIRSVFKSSNDKSNVSSSSNSFKVQEKYSNERFYVVYDKSGSVLSTIPEAPEFEIGSLSPEISSLVKRSASERFTTIGIACA
ncbi:unnamed protein product [Lathyrus oleraceus]|uniref:Avr9/Cf-9 rapidly elicited protein 194 n=1 Tax=Pisum sativum TaxID=3888 RepID=A0A9D4YNS4_PEA|nr:uncharacterized protein LOC127120802 [Pisum sativum]KAI5440041.1 hypothetical protein KIW84_025411 [Pisum sativum]